ncbi:hypothetical protein H6P81_010823 [Aristolochia fimbriata]|uniref:Uncharacterized protein n=1 Tax=Aristolochia fimbriata TaxID=158543 RepID=A0AAV7EU99_ARIFI|nr:hypothetical protein H6P81_010823 [Aristolochia fimbriata]
MEMEKQRPETETENREIEASGGGHPRKFPKLKGRFQSDLHWTPSLFIFSWEEPSSCSSPSTQLCSRSRQVEIPHSSHFPNQPGAPHIRRPTAPPASRSPSTAAIPLRPNRPHQIEVDIITTRRSRGDALPMTVVEVAVRSSCLARGGSAHGEPNWSHACDYVHPIGSHERYARLYIEGRYEQEPYFCSFAGWVEKNILDTRSYMGLVNPARNRMHPIQLNSVGVTDPSRSGFFLTNPIQNNSGTKRPSGLKKPFRIKKHRGPPG